VRFALMIEGQEDVTWGDWVALADACETLDIEALFRSDHYLSVAGIDGRGSLDAWGTINALAAITTKLRLGALVSPATFRHPSVFAKLAATADHVSDGRIEVGLGAGWMEAEHRAYGFPFGTLRDRMDAYAEQLEIVHRSFAPGPFTFRGRFFTIEDLDALPKPIQQPRPPMIVGGSAAPRGAALGARWADEYNVAFASPAQAAEKCDAIHAACRDIRRDPSTIVVSLMTGLVLGRDRDEVARRAAAVGAVQGRPPDDPHAYAAELSGNWIVGTAEEVVARLREYERAGIQRVFLQHLAHRDLDMVELLAREVIPALRS
jgi:alkanesulfonate monooxygenase SsuD/methylene tetrahydromethanopterin reductase-like flavin-dependent oxidoreductase (luciferase family)